MTQEEKIILALFSTPIVLPLIWGLLYELTGYIPNVGLIIATAVASVALAAFGIYLSDQL